MNTFLIIIVCFIAWVLIGLFITIHSSKYWRKDIDSEATLVVYAFGSFFWPLVILFNLKNYYNDIVRYIKQKMNKQEYLDSLDKNDCLSIIKYGLRGSNAPEDVTVEDIWHIIGSLYIYETM